MLRDAGATEVHLRDLVAAVPLALLLRHRHARRATSCWRRTAPPTRSREFLGCDIDRLHHLGAPRRGDRGARRGVLRRLPHRAVPDARAPRGPRVPPGSGRERAASLATYAAAGVDVAAGEAAVAQDRRALRSADRPGVLGSIGRVRRRGSRSREGGWRDPGARGHDRRGRHQARGRPRGRRALDGRHRPRGDVRRRPRLHRGRAPLLPRLPRRRPPRARTRVAELVAGDRRGVLRGRLRAARR